MTHPICQAKPGILVLNKTKKTSGKEVSQKEIQRGESRIAEMVLGIKIRNHTQQPPRIFKARAVRQAESIHIHPRKEQVS